MAFWYFYPIVIFYNFWDNIFIEVGMFKRGYMRTIHDVKQGDYVRVIYKKPSEWRNEQPTEKLLVEDVELVKPFEEFDGTIHIKINDEWFSTKYFNHNAFEIVNR